jgi:hypothetical protein
LRELLRDGGALREGVARVVIRRCACLEAVVLKPPQPAIAIAATATPTAARRLTAIATPGLRRCTRDALRVSELPARTANSVLEQMKHFAR